MKIPDLRYYHKERDEFIGPENSYVVRVDWCICQVRSPFEDKYGVSIWSGDVLYSIDGNFHFQVYFNDTVGAIMIRRRGKINWNKYPDKATFRNAIVVGNGEISDKYDKLW